MTTKQIDQMRIVKRVQLIGTQWDDDEHCLASIKKVYRQEERELAKERKQAQEDADALRKLGPITNPLLL